MSTDVDWSVSLVWSGLFNQASEAGLGTNVNDSFETSF